MNTKQDADPRNPIHEFNTHPLTQFVRTRDEGHTAITRPQVYNTSSLPDGYCLLKLIWKIGNCPFFI